MDIQPNKSFLHNKFLTRLDKLSKGKGATSNNDNATKLTSALKYVSRGPDLKPLFKFTFVHAEGQHLYNLFEQERVDTHARVINESMDVLKEEVIMSTIKQMLPSNSFYRR